MKKLFLFFCLTFLTAVLILSCKKNSDTPADCTALSAAIATASTNYGSSQTTANCNALKTAYANYLSSTCPSASDKTMFQQALDALKALCP